MKHLFIPLALLSLLSGCVTVPYDDSYGTYASEPYDEEIPVYAGGAPLYTGSGVPVYAGPPAYFGPPVFFDFGLHYWNRGHGHHHGHRDGHWGNGQVRGGWGQRGSFGHR